MTRKHTKYSPDYNKQLALLIPTTEKVKDATGQEVEKNKIARLLSERTTLNNEIIKLESDIKKSGSAYAAVRYLKKRIELWEDSTNAPLLQNASDSFHIGAYNWEAKVKAWYQTADTNYKNNLYKLKLNGTNYEITEEEILNLMARVVEAFKEIDDADFIAKYGALSSTPHTTQIGYITAIKNEGNLIKVGSDKTSRKSYHFAETYPQNHKNYTKYAGTRIYNEFFDLVKAVKADESFLSNLDSSSQSKVPQTEKYQIFLKGNKYTEAELKDYGIEIKSDQSLYKTGKTKKEFEVKGGVKGWIDLANTIADDNNRAKLLNSLTRTNNPNWNLFNDLLDSHNNLENGLGGSENKANTFRTTTTGTTDLGLDAMPRSLDEYHKLLAIFKSKSGADNIRVAKWVEEADQKITLRTQKETEIDQMIIAQLTELRAKQLPALKITDGFKITYQADGTTVDKDNRRSRQEISQIKSLLEDIRYLENDGEEELSSTVDNENTAYAEVVRIEDEAKSHLLYNLTIDSGTNQEKIDKIKKNPAQGTSYLQRCLDEFTRVEKHIKLNDSEAQLKKDIETAMGKKDDTETLKTYTDKLKIFDPTLETAFTEDLKTKWQGDEAKNFQNSTSLKTLLESVKKNDKYDDFFNEIKKGEKGFTEVKDVDTFGKLLVKDPKVVITVVKRYEYDKRGTSDEKSLEGKTQWERWIKKLYTKDKDHSLTDAEINTAVYEIAIGTKEMGTKALKADLTEYKTDEKRQEEEKTHLQKWWPLYVGIGVGVLAIGGACYYFWESIINWWNQKEKGDKYESDE